MRPVQSLPSGILPSNATLFERSQVDTDGYRTLAIPLPLRDLFDPDRCPSEMLDILAYSWSVDEWEPGWPIERKREAIRLSPAFHRVKGTKGALRRAVESLGYAGLEIAEWFEYGGDPYRFKITLDITDRAFDLADYEQIYRAAIRAKNVRSHLEAVATRLRRTVVGYAGVAGIAVVRARLLPARPPRLSVRFSPGTGICLMPVVLRARLNPMPA